MPPKKRFATRADEGIAAKSQGLRNAAARRLGGGPAVNPNLPGAKFGGKVSGQGLGATVSQVADRAKKFQPLGGGSTVPTTGGVNTPGGPNVPGVKEVVKKKVT